MLAYRQGEAFQPVLAYRQGEAFQPAVFQPVRALLLPVPVYRQGGGVSAGSSILSSASISACKTVFSSGGIVSILVMPR